MTAIMSDNSVAPQHPAAAPIILPLEDYPETIRMSGLPFLLRGWNADYSRRKTLSDGVPTYRLESYVHYIVPIVGATIMRIGGVWTFVPDNASYTTLEKMSVGSALPCGKWSYGAVVMPVY